MKQRILAVDDEVHMLKLLERIILEKTPYQIVVTNNALEAVDILEKEQFDLVITDLRMPAMDGMDLLRMIKEKGRREEVIMITAFGTLETATEALSLGVFDYINKPFKKEQLLGSVGRAMDCQKNKREAASLVSIFNTEPYSKALEIFEREYAKRLAERGEDAEELARRAGIPAERLDELLKRNGTG